MNRKTGPVAIFLKGFLMGAADVVPGVSGGTMAFITGIYDRLVHSLGQFDLQALTLLLKGQWSTFVKKTDFYFLIVLLMGIGSALIFFTKVISIPYFIEHQPAIIYGLFFGLVLSTLVLLFMGMNKPSAHEAMCVLLGILFLFVVQYFLPKDTPSDPWFMFFYGAIAISAMVLPGISGSFILLLLGQYTVVLEALSTFNLMILLPFALGCGLGIVSFSRLLDYLIKHYYRKTIFFICGILFGSLWILWPFQERTYAWVGEKRRLIETLPYWPSQINQDLLFSFVAALLGFLAVWWISKKADLKGVGHA